MLHKIFIQNFALIEKLEINLHAGLQVITGETGTGKSIILGALRLILGERADLKSFGNIENKSIVEATFKIKNNHKQFFEDHDLDFENETIIRREILPTGKSRAFINDVPVNLEILKEFSQKLIDIHSQFETSNLFDEEYQFRIIDGLSENKTLIETYQNSYFEFQKKENELKKIRIQLAEAQKQKDYNLFLLNELEEADIENLDFEELQSQVFTNENAELIAENLRLILLKLNQEEIGILANFYEIKNKLQKISDASPHFLELKQRLETLFLELKDIGISLENEAENLDLNPENLALYLAKLNKINALFLKHQVNEIGDLIAIKSNLVSEQNSLENLEKNIAETEDNLAKISIKLENLGENLAKNRKISAPIFKTKIETLLTQLGLEKAKIEVDLSSTKTFGKFGKQKIELQFQANSGFPMKPIQAAISGGERSRVMLSIKKLMADNTELPTLILDEIDTGVSGKIAEETGNVMQEMAKNMQLIVITHLPQVAAKGNNNYKVLKQEFGGKTQSNIVSLNQEEKLVEIAQLLSGSKITDAAMQQAKELMN